MECCSCAVQIRDLTCNLTPIALSQRIEAESRSAIFRGTRLEVPSAATLSGWWWPVNHSSCWQTSVRGGINSRNAREPDLSGGYGFDLGKEIE